MNYHVTRVQAELEPEEQERLARNLPPCPVCGEKAYISRDCPDGFFMGWSVGCPRFKHDDGVHGTTFGTPDKDLFAKHGFITNKSAAQWWRRRVSRYERGKADA